MRLIDADALKEKICNNVYPITDFFNSRDYGMFWAGGIEKAIDEAPTIDAEPIIRCKNCEYYNGEDKYCVNDIFAKSNGYCMYGKEKDE